MLPLKKILCAIDLGETSPEALKAAGHLARAFHAKLSVLHVLEPEEPPFGIVSRLQFSASREADVRRGVQACVEEHLGQLVPVDIRVRTGDPGAEITGEACDTEADLVVICTHGRKGWQHLAIGSVAETVVRVCPRPVLTVGESVARQWRDDNAGEDEINPNAGVLLPPLPADPRAVLESEFPEDGTHGDKLRFLVNYAVLAPSSYNAQPWAWRLADDALELYVDRSRAAPTTDPEGRELFIACGAALFNLRVAMRHFQYQDDVRTMPEPANPDLLARIHISGQRWATEEDDALFEAIPQRRTHRQPFASQELPATFLFDVKAIARQHGVRLRVISPEERNAVVSLVQKGALAQGGSEDFRKEVTAWMRPAGDTRRDGLPAGVLDASTFAEGRAQAAHDGVLASEAPVLVLLDTDCDAPRDWVLAGEALEHILLHACSQNVAVSYFNQPIHISALWRKLLQELRLSSFPQLLFRFGRAEEAELPALTPRRPLEEVLMESSSVAAEAAVA